ncbi:MAG TPA: hypothetical protein VKB96_13435, partial [Gammaproteobacteria bacterium]|nr:hypothetical protein [Gammaproteobacteria bacterium]
MRKQLNTTTRAHLIRGAFYLLLLLAVCAIPFALAQSRSRGAINPSIVSTAVNQTAVSDTAAAPPTSGAVKAQLAVPPYPKQPQV